MATSEQNRSKNTIMYKNIAQFCYAVYMNNERAMLELLKNGYDVNARISPDHPFKTFSTGLDGMNALQFACGESSMRSVNVLLDKGADFTMSNSYGSTALYLSVQDYGCEVPPRIMDYICEEDSVALPILSAHVKNNVTINPVNNHGLSHFHIACMVSHVEAVKLFLGSGVQINEAIHNDSPILPGYTALHIAVRYGSLEVVQLLVSYEADVHVRNKDRHVPLQLLCSRLEEMSYLALHRERYQDHQEIHIEFQNDTYEIASILIQKTFKPDTFTNELCIACAEKCLDTVNEILEKGVDINARASFGFTALHCAALIDFDVTKLLLERGANIFLQNDDGTTPLDICTWKYGYDIIQLLPFVQQLGPFVIQNGQSWRIALAMHSNEILKDTLSDDDVAREINSACISSESPVWPGVTPLHLAMIFARIDPREYDPNDWRDTKSNPVCTKDMIEILILRGASMTQQDAKDQTPVHLAFHLKKRGYVKLLLDPERRPIDISELVSRENPVDKTGLSHFHMACIMGCKEGIRILSSNNEVVNDPIKSDLVVGNRSKKPDILLKAGSTPLHITARLKKIKAIEILALLNADIFARDADGLTPIDILATNPEFKSSELVKLTIMLICKYCILDSNFVLNKEKMSHFETLCIAVDPILFSVQYSINLQPNNPELMRQFREINEARRNNGREDLGMSLDLLETMREFTSRKFDANAFAARCMSSLKTVLPKSSKTDIFIYKCFKSYHQLVPCQWESLVVLDDQSQLTNLHLACALKQKESIELLMKTGADVNCCLSANSPFFPGFTPLHLAIRCCKQETERTYVKVVQIMLKAGADPTIQDVNGETALHLADRYQFKAIKYLLLRDGRSIQKNLISKFGRSHFHIACSSILPEVVEKMLQNGADPNELNYVDDNEVWQEAELSDVPYFFDFTPLHNARHLPVVQVLLKNGADPKIEDYKGWTVLHRAAHAGCDAEIIKTLIRDGGANVNSRSVLHFTPLDLIVTEKMESEEHETQIRTLLEHGALVIHENFEESSTLTRAFESEDMELLQTLVKYGIDVKDSNELERTAMHELFLGYLNNPNEYIIIIEQLCRKGIDIDCQDSLRRTPLHLAVQKGLEHGTTALLACGANVNMTGNEGHTPLSLLADDSTVIAGVSISLQQKQKMALILFQHIRKMQQFNIPVSYKNTNLEKKSSEIGNNESSQESLNDETDKPQQYHNELEKMKETILEDNVTLHDVMFMDSHRLATLVKNDTLNSILSLHDLYKKFPELGGILKLKFRIAQRKRAMNFARKALYLLLGKRIPDTCTEIIATCLSNKDLKTLAVMMVK